MRVPFLPALACLLIASGSLDHASAQGPGAAAAVEPKEPGRGDALRELEALPTFQRAQSALADGLAGVAALALEELGAREDLSPGAMKVVRHLRIEALVRGGRYAEALALFEADELPFWRGSALAGLGRLTDARPLLAAVSEDASHPHRELALLTLVSLLVAAEDSPRALELLSARVRGGGASGKLVLALAELQLRTGAADAALKTLELHPAESPGGSTAVDLLRAEALLRLERPVDAIELGRGLLAAPPASMPSALRSRASLLLADAYLSRDEVEEASDVLEAYIETAPPEASRLPAFDRLADAGALINEAGEGPIVKWLASPRPEISRVARYFLGESLARGDKRAEAIAALDAVAEADDSLAVRAKLLLAELHLQGGVEEDAEAAIKRLREATSDPEVLARVSFVEARLSFEEGEFEAAAEQLNEVTGKVEDVTIATYDAAIASLRAGDEAEFRARSALLPEIKGDPYRADLALERALYLASREDPSAAEELRKFIEQHPKSKRIAEAHLALAGLYVLELPTKTKSARDSLAAARAAGLDPIGRERADYLAFWVAETAGESEEAAALADAFMEVWPNSALAPSVRMRQAEVFYRNGDFLDALSRFERLANDYPDSPLADRALFFAGRAAMLTLTADGRERALTLWQKLADRKSALAPLARRHQAQVRMRDGGHAEAIELLQLIIDDPAASTALKVSAHILKGEAQFILGQADGSGAEKALVSFDAALAIKGIGPAARNEALFRKGKAHEALGRIPEALDCYHQIITLAGAATEAGGVPEYKWFYRAGFESIRILEARAANDADVAAAIAIADDLAATRGPRANEARKAAEKMRLEHFHWRD